MWDRWNNELDDKQRASLYERVKEPFDENNYNLGKQGFPTRVVRDYLDGKYGEQPEWKDWEKKLYDLRMSYVDEDLRELAKRPELLVSEDDEKNYSSAFSRLTDWMGRANQLLQITPEVLAARARPEKKSEARDIVAEIDSLSNEERFSRMLRDIMGADFHEMEAALEQTPEARAAREHRQAVRDRYNAGQPEEANKEFLASFDSWIALLHREDFPKLRYLPQMNSELMDETEKYLIVLEQLETVFPKEFSFQEVIRRDERVAARLKASAESEAFIAKELEDGKVKEAREDALALLSAWQGYNGNNPIFELGPLPESVESVFNTARLWIKAWEQAPETEFDLAKQTGVFNDYYCRDFIEFMIQKRDDSYAEIEKLEVARMNDAEKNFDSLKQEIDLWAKVVESAPVLKYDSSSDISAQIANTVQEYQTELQKRSESLPDDFPLKAFVARPDGT